MSYTLKLLICYHKKSVLLKDDVLTPIHVGRALARRNMNENSSQLKWLEENMIGDDTGENISEKNSSYNELTAAYWAWKNYDKLGNPDYIGLMHYRRHFIFRESPDVVEEVLGIDHNYFKRINYNKDTVLHLMDDCDYVAHIGHVDEVYKHYKENHHIEDLDLAISILKDKYPAYASTADDYLKMSYVNLCNMFIMPRKMFFDYCAWLFDVLQEFENKVDLTEKRLFISERLTGIYIEHQKRKGLRLKALSATLVLEDINIPVVIPYCGDTFRMAVTMSSIMSNAARTTHIDFYILHQGELTGAEFKCLTERYPGNKVDYVDVTASLNNSGILWHQFKFPQHYPIVVSAILPEVNKLLYIDENTFFFGDIARLYAACNNDEFMVIGIPDNSLNSIGLKQCSIFSINTLRIRKCMDNDISNPEANCSAASVFRKNIENQIGYFPCWTYVLPGSDEDDKIFYEKIHAEQRGEHWSRIFMYFKKDAEPWKKIWAISSMFWWEVAYTIPAEIAFTGVDEEALKNIDNIYADLLKKHAFISGLELNEKPETKCGIIKKTINYFKSYGLKKTIIKIINKISAR